MYQVQNDTVHRVQKLQSMAGNFKFKGNIIKLNEYLHVKLL